MSRANTAAVKARRRAARQAEADHGEIHRLDRLYAALDLPAAALVCGCPPLRPPGGIIAVWEAHMRWTGA